MTMLRIAGVSIPPQLMREPYDRGYRGIEPIVSSVSANEPGVKASGELEHVGTNSATSNVQRAHNRESSTHFRFLSAQRLCRVQQAKLGHNANDEQATTNSKN